MCFRNISGILQLYYKIQKARCKVVVKVIVGHCLGYACYIVLGFAYRLSAFSCYSFISLIRHTDSAIDKTCFRSVTERGSS